MNPSTIYLETGPQTGSPRSDMRAHTIRICRLELCSAWLRGPIPTWFYCEPAGRLHPGAVSFTLRAFRVMLGYRWYAANDTDQQRRAPGSNP